MTIEQFEHILRACQGNTDETGFYIIGTASLLAQHPELAEGEDGVVTSHEADVWPTSGNPKTADLLEAIGEMSPFHEQFGILPDHLFPGRSPAGCRGMHPRWVSSHMYSSSPSNAEKNPVPRWRLNLLLRFARISCPQIPQKISSRKRFFSAGPA